MKRKLLSALLLAVLLLLGGPGNQQGARAAEETEDSPRLEYNTIEELGGAGRFAIPIGTIFDQTVKEHFPGAEVLYYPGPVECALALSSGKADAVVFDAPSLRYITACTEGVALMPEYIAKDDYYFILPRSASGEQLRKEFNSWLSGQKESGELSRMADYWCGSEEPEAPLDFDSLPDVNGVVRIVTASGSRPDSYSKGTGITGFPAELIWRFCRDNGYAAQISMVSFDAEIASIVTGKADILIGLFSYTEERAKSVLFTDSIMEGGIGVLVRSQETAKSASVWSALSEGLKKTFITDGRWQLILSGLGVTVLVTLGGFLLANILGAGGCACVLSRHKGLNVLFDVYDRVMQGTPMVVVLMVLYYVIFGKSRLSGVWIAIFAFGLVSGSALARQFSGAITGVDRGQTEAALAIGFTPARAFIGIVLPQAVRSALPGYFSELIGLMKGTAVIGYIAVNDLTKAGDLIRSSTYDAFFPLLSVAVVYFLIAFLILSLLKALLKKLSPRRVQKQEAAK